MSEKGNEKMEVEKQEQQKKTQLFIPPEIWNHILGYRGPKGGLEDVSLSDAFSTKRPLLKVRGPMKAKLVSLYYKYQHSYFGGNNWYGKGTIFLVETDKKKSIFLKYGFYLEFCGTSRGWNTNNRAQSSALANEMNRKTILNNHINNTRKALKNKHWKIGKTERDNLLDSVEAINVNSNQNGFIRDNNTFTPANDGVIGELYNEKSTNKFKWVSRTGEEHVESLGKLSTHDNKIFVY